MKRWQIRIPLYRYESNRCPYSFADFVSQYGVEVNNDLVFDMRSPETVHFSTGLGSVFRPYPYWMRSPVADRKVAGGVDLVILRAHLPCASLRLYPVPHTANATQRQDMRCL